MVGKCTAPTSSALLRWARCTRRRPAMSSDFLPSLLSAAADSKGATPPPSVAAADGHVDLEAGRHFAEVMTSSQRTGGHEPPARTRPAWVNPGGISSQWCVTRTRWARGVDGQRAANCTSNRSRAPRSSPAKGSSSRTSSGCPSAPGPAGPAGARPRRSRRRGGRRSRPPHPGPEGLRLLPVLVRVAVPPGLERAVAAARHHVAGCQCRSQLPGDGAADQRDPRAQGPHVDPAEASAQYLDGAGGRPETSAGHLAKSSCPNRWGQGDPAFVVLDLPVDARRARDAFAADPDVRQGEDGSAPPAAAVSRRWWSTCSMRRLTRPIRPEQNAPRCVRRPARARAHGGTRRTMCSKASREARPWTATAIATTARPPGRRPRSGPTRGARRGHRRARRRLGPSARRAREE